MVAQKNIVSIGLVTITIPSRFIERIFLAPVTIKHYSNRKLGDYHEKKVMNKLSHYV